MMPSWWISLGLALFTSSVSWSQDEARTVTIPWGPVSGASGYDFQISRKSDLNPVDNQQSTTANEVSLRLSPGTYYFRIRGRLRNGTSTAWSGAQSVTIQPKAPEQTYPPERFLFSKELAGTGIPLRWKASRTRSYLVEVTDAGGRVVFRSNVDRSGIDWTPDSSVGVGTYFWRVGLPIGANGEWGPKRSFDLSPRALGLPDPASSGGAEISLGTEYWILGRAAQALVAYSVTDRDFGSSLSTNGLSGLYGVDFQWGPKPGIGRGLTGSISGGVMTQIISGTSSINPRGSIRVGYQRSGATWFGGPFVHAGFLFTQALTMASATTVTGNRIFRGQGGIGGELGYRLVPNVSLHLRGMLRADLAGAAIAAGSAPGVSLNYEGRLGARWSLSKSIGIDFGASAWLESMSWTAAATTTSSSIGTWIVFDAGLGVRF